jgi:hypothetical protein
VAGQAPVLGLALQQGQHGLVATVHTVEIADGQRTGRRQGCMMETAKDLHGSALSRLAVNLRALHGQRVTERRFSV